MEPYLSSFTQLLCLSVFVATAASADPIPVSHKQGEVHAFLSIRNDDGKVIGYADAVNAPVGRTWALAPDHPLP